MVLKVGAFHGVKYVLLQMFCNSKCNEKVASCGTVAVILFKTRKNKSSYCEAAVAPPDIFISSVNCFAFLPDSLQEFFEKDLQ